ncbi:hypothetical protein KQI49_06020 [Virgibacillus sp. MSJ-26]|uniref:hypothetical protein n=1 Tax=Virgibacillus sp. MSJ-26 TaxID=2841522 RepID=UPI001C0F5AFC|nr:hypothetical protein [Virgibacillus sp. MSJ-26]MBU5466391.1 hypothetical protein [Virgibacillus sp. MSJ-26]
MRNKFFYFNNQRGFFLPYVLFIVSLTFLLVTTNIKLYDNEIHMMHHLIEQIKIETLIQMSHMKYREDVNQSNHIPEVISYTFPSGDVTISFLNHKENRAFVHYQITTDNNISFSINDYIELAHHQNNRN